MLDVPVPCTHNIQHNIRQNKKTKKKTRLEPKGVQMCALDGAYGGAFFLSFSSGLEMMNGSSDTHNYWLMHGMGRVHVGRRANWCFLCATEQ